MDPREKAYGVFRREKQDPRFLARVLGPGPFEGTRTRELVTNVVPVSDEKKKEDQESELKNPSNLGSSERVLRRILAGNEF